MRVPGLKTLRQAGRWLRSRYTGGALILGYHRVASVNHDPHHFCVSPQHFEGHLAVLRRVARPVALPDLVHALQEGRVPQRAVAVTFDDGYADVLYHAYPLLQRYGVNATLFVVTGCLGGSFSWDARLPSARETHCQPRALTVAELQELAAGDLFHIGAHTVSHPRLATLPDSEQCLEIEESKATLEKLLDRRPVHGFSYPHGLASHLTRELVRRSGYTYACTSFNDVARAGSDLFYLPRFWPGDWDSGRFARWLGWWLDG